MASESVLLYIFNQSTVSDKWTKIMSYVEGKHAAYVIK